MLEKAKAIQDQLIAWRRDFHMHPELGFQETRTAAIVADTLEKLGCRVRRGVGKTGVVAELGEGKPVIAMRADMDALPIQEANAVPYASQNPGVMHACGHDAHTTILLGVASLLSKESFPGTVRFLFQPSEEAADEEGISGAPRMIRDGAIDGVDMVLALHVDPTYAVGDISNQAGAASGGVDSWFGRVIGKGGHGAMPQDAIDPIFISAQVIFAINGIVSRRLDPFNPAVVSIGAIHAGQAENVIPGAVEFAGTLRYTEAEVQKAIHTELTHAFSLARVLGGDYELRFEIGMPPMINHPNAVELIQQTAVALLGEGHIVAPRKGLGAEDFGCFSELVPGAMFGLGVRADGDLRYPHNPHFDIDERALPIGTAILAESALRFLIRESSVVSRQS
jgi:amidohydrolase